MIGWVLLSREAVARADQALSSQEKGVLDEVGFLALHVGFADRFFPGTSVLHTRLRYALFVPWLIHDVCRGGTEDLARRLQKDETDLAKQLMDGGKDRSDIDATGVVGARVWPKPAAQPPSLTYWSALSAWGLLRRRADGSSPARVEVLRQLSKAYSKSKLRLTDDDGQNIESGASDPFVRLPDPPEAFGRRGEVLDFSLTSPEREFLRKRLLAVRRPTTSTPSLLARLVDASDGLDAEAPWDASIGRIADADDRSALELAHAAAAMGGIGRAVYATLVEHMQARDGLRPSGVWDTRLRECVAELGPAALQLDIRALRDTLPHLPDDLVAVMTATKDWLAASAKPVDVLLEPYSRAEHARKTLRARLPDREAARKRRADWVAEEHPMATPLHYRWFTVRRLLTDLLT